MTSSSPARSKPKPVAPWPPATGKEIRRMSLKLTRFLDASASITIVFLALYVGAATFGLGV